MVKQFRITHTVAMVNPSRYRKLFSILFILHRFSLFKSEQNCLAARFMANNSKYFIYIFYFIVYSTSYGPGSTRTLAAVSSIVTST